MNGTPVMGLRISFSDRVEYCSDRHFKSATSMDLSIPGETLSPGTFTVIDPNTRSASNGEAEGDFNTVTDTCTQGSVTASTIGGTVVLTQTSPTLKGTVDLKFPNGDKVSGAFEAVDCGTGAASDGVVCN